MDFGLTRGLKAGRGLFAILFISALLSSYVDDTFGSTTDFDSRCARMFSYVDEIGALLSSYVDGIIIGVGSGLGSRGDTDHVLPVRFLSGCVVCALLSSYADEVLVCAGVGLGSRGDTDQVLPVRSNSGCSVCCVFARDIIAPLPLVVCESNMLLSSLSARANQSLMICGVSGAVLGLSDAISYASFRPILGLVFVLKSRQLNDPTLLGVSPYQPRPVIVVVAIGFDVDVVLTTRSGEIF